jgi:hypothetical protein
LLGIKYVQNYKTLEWTYWARLEHIKGRAAKGKEGLGVEMQRQGEGDWGAVEENMLRPV